MMATKTSGKKYRREALLKDSRFAGFQKDFLGAVLKNEEYTWEEAKKAVEAFFGKEVN